MEITGIPTNAIDALDHDSIEASAASRFQKLSETDTPDECLGRHGAVLEYRDFAIALAFQVASAELHLVFNGTVRLERGRITGVNCGTAAHSVFSFASCRAALRAIALTSSNMSGSPGPDA
nr:hypothetical protein [Limimaricola litoreus]